MILVVNNSDFREMADYFESCFLFLVILLIIALRGETFYNLNTGQAQSKALLNKKGITIIGILAKLFDIFEINKLFSAYP